MAQKGDQDEPQGYKWSTEEKEKKEEGLPQGWTGQQTGPHSEEDPIWREPLEEDERARVANSGGPLGEKGAQRNSCRKGDEK